MNSLSPLRIGLFGGTFDPIHLGHLILAETAFEELSLDRLIFIPAKVSPYKKEQPPRASNNDRLTMIQLAIADKEGWSVDDRELVREGVSFTIDTVRSFQKEFPEAAFFLFIGEDQLEGLFGWKESEALLKLVSVVVLARSLTGPEKEIRKEQRSSSLKKSFLWVHRSIDISATEIRKRCSEGDRVAYLLPFQVALYLKERELYQRKRATNNEKLSPKGIC